MSSNGPKALVDLLGAGSLENLTNRTRQHRELTAEIRAALPADEAEHLVLAQIGTQGELILTMDSAAWAARVRYRAGQLGRRAVKVKVLPSSL